VYRTFHHDPDDIRITLHNTTEQQLMACRRIASRLADAGRTPAEAHELVSRAAKIAWRQDRLLVEVMVGEGLDGGLPADALRGAVQELESDSQALSDARKARLEAVEGFRSPAALSALSGEQLAGFDAVFAPGGHAPMTDLPDNPDVGRLLAVLCMNEIVYRVLRAEQYTRLIEMAARESASNPVSAIIAYVHEHIGEPLSVS
jgi:hypothetical protein